jgi:hypothetical protein
LQTKCEAIKSLGVTLNQLGKSRVAAALNNAGSS